MFKMGFLALLTDTLFAIWCACEVVIGLISFVNRFRGPSEEGDKFSFFVMWLSIGFPIAFTVVIWDHVIFPTGFGSFATLSPLLGYLGCLVIVFGIAVRLVAVATLKGQFTTTVYIAENDVIVDTGLYKTIRHPSYLGILAAELGFGLASGNWVSLAVAVVLPLAGSLYRMHVEEAALLHHFGLAYQEYASRTKRLLPGIY
jgi:protein-S-isoprenylcysteine O-methyltransferase